MKQVFKIEMRKVADGNLFKSAMAFGLIISISNVFHSMETVNTYSAFLAELIEGGWAISHSYEGFSLFVNWIALNPLSFGNNLFYFVWPILAAMPYGWSYSADRRSGYYNQIVSRSNAKTYFVAKYLAVYIGGGLVVSLPILVDLLLNALISPMCIPDVTMGIHPIFNCSFLSSLYYTYPWAYALLWCLLHFIWGGTTASLCFVVGAKIRLNAVVVLIPFASYVLFDALSTTFSYLTGIKQGFSPLNLIKAVSLSPSSGYVIFAVLVVLTVCGLLFGYRQVVKNELE